MNVLSLTLTGAVTALVTPAIQLTGRPRSIVAQFNLVYGSGGTTFDFYLQTSIDKGVTWTDIANFHATTASLRRLINLSSVTAVTTQVTPTDGSMTANTAQDGIVGTWLRGKYTSTGTYAGGTTFSADIAADLIQPYQ
jgi:hypothetical protein